MALSRRALGLGLLGVSAAATGGLYFASGQGLLSGPNRTITGFYGGEKQRFLQNPAVIAAIDRRANLTLDARVAGSVEMVRERALLDQGPAFLWPSSQVNVEIARASGLRIRRNETILNAPIVLFSWEVVAEGLVSAGLATKRGESRYGVDMPKLVKSIVDGRSWTELGVKDLFGRARLLSSDPNRSNSGFLLSGLVANVLAGDVATRADLPRVLPDLGQLFGRMGFKPHSSGKIFDDYLAGGIGGFPLIAGYENQLIEWIVADPERWSRVLTRGGPRPVVIYPEPTVLSAHPLMILKEEAAPLVDALLHPDVLEIAWVSHGFRGPLGALGRERNPLFAQFIEPDVRAVIPTPDAETMMEIIDFLARAPS